MLMERPIIFNTSWRDEDDRGIYSPVNNDPPITSTIKEKNR
jgi:hypothetical protein